RRAVIIKIREAASPPYPFPVPSQPPPQSGVDEEPVPPVVVQRRGLIGEVRFQDVKPAVAVKVAGGHSHSGRRLPVGVEGAAGKDAHLLESAVAAGVKQQARTGGGCYVHVRATR